MNNTETKVNQKEVMERLNNHSKSISEIGAKLDKHIASSNISNEKTQKELAKIGNDTEEIIGIYSDVKTVIKVSKKIKGFVQWFITIPLIGTGVYTLYKYFTGD